VVRWHLLLEPGVAAVRGWIRRLGWVALVGGGVRENVPEHLGQPALALPVRLGLLVSRLCGLGLVGHEQRPAKSRSSELASMPGDDSPSLGDAVSDGDSVVEDSESDDEAVLDDSLSLSSSLGLLVSEVVAELDGVLVGTWSAPMEPTRSLPSGWSLAIRFHSVSASSVHSTRPGCSVL
jgi:hypothetical protein